MFEKIKKNFYEFGASVVISKFVIFLMRKLKLPTEIEILKLEVSLKLRKDFENKIFHGHFKALNLPNDLSRKEISGLSPLFLFSYEKELLEEIHIKSKLKKYFLDLGADRGIVSAGVLTCGWFEKAFCFEISKKKQKQIENYFKQIDMMDKLELYGKANEDNLSLINPCIIANSFVKCDIEGGEFDLFNLSMIEKLHNSIILIEIHKFVKDFEQKYDVLYKNFQTKFYLKEIFMEERDPSKFIELQNFPDSLRFLAMSEGRYQSPLWLLATPKNIQ